MLNQPTQPDEPAKRHWNVEPYDAIARAIAEQLRQIATATREVESLWVRAPQREVGRGVDSFITEVEREWWLVLEVGQVITVTLREEDGTRLGVRTDQELVYDRDAEAATKRDQDEPAEQGEQRDPRLPEGSA